MGGDTDKKSGKKPRRRMKATYSKIREQVDIKVIY
jgi:hypothetical protein